MLRKLNTFRGQRYTWIPAPSRIMPPGHETTTPQASALRPWSRCRAAQRSRRQARCRADTTPPGRRTTPLVPQQATFAWFEPRKARDRVALANQTAMDLPFFREPSYHVLSRQDAAWRADLGTYRAWSSTQSQSDGPAVAPVAIYSANVRTRRYVSVACSGVIVPPRTDSGRPAD